MKVGRIILIVLILMSTAALVYSPHLRYKYPLHADEWNRIALAKALDHGEDVNLLGMKYEIIFISFLRFLDKHVDLLMFYRFLPARFAAFTGLCLFLFVYYLSKYYYLLHLSMFFYATINFNYNIIFNIFFFFF